MEGISCEAYRWVFFGGLYVVVGRVVGMEHAADVTTWWAKVELGAKAMGKEVSGPGLAPAAFVVMAVREEEGTMSVVAGVAAAAVVVGECDGRVVVVALGYLGS